MKKILVSILILIMLCGCGMEKKEPASATTAETKESKEATENTDFEAKCKEIEDKYNLEIIYGGKVMDFINSENVDYSYDEKNNYAALEAIDEVFSKLPEGFMEELRNVDGKQKDISIMFCSGETNVCKVVNVTPKSEMWLIQVDERPNMYLTITLYESMYNYMKSKDENILSDWSKYNPENFKYCAADEIESVKKYALADNQDDPYFIEYACLTSEFFDQGFTWGILLYAHSENLEKIYNLPHIRAKAEYICAEVNKAFETADESAYWNRFFTK